MLDISFGKTDDVIEIDQKVQKSEKTSQLESIGEQTR
jgi:hypothetical protein